MRAEIDDAVRTTRKTFSEARIAKRASCCVIGAASLGPQNRFRGKIVGMSSVISDRALTTPQTLTLFPPFSDEEFERLCEENDGVRIERTREGVIRMNPPTGFLTGDGNSEINTQLRNWWRTHRRGRVVDSNTGVQLPDNSILVPDAAYASAEQLEGFTRAELSRRPHLCPAFVIELLSETDSIEEARAKMRNWQLNGAALGWLIDPYKKVVHVYEAGKDAWVFAGTELAGTGPMAGFTLNLLEVWRCYEV